MCYNNNNNNNNNVVLRGGGESLFSPQLLSPDSSPKLSIIGFCSRKNSMVCIILGEKKEETKAPTTPPTTLELMILLHLLKSS
jgi:hypothetical protein